MDSFILIFFSQPALTKHEYTLLCSVIHIYSLEVPNLTLRAGAGTPEGLKQLDYCTFPKLRSLSLEGFLTGPVCDLVRRHKDTLNRLFINDFAPDYAGISPPLGPFPSLLIYEGPGDLLPSIAPGAPLRQVCVEMDRGCRPVDSALALVALSQTTDCIREVCIRSEYWDGELLTLLAEHAPDVEDLRYEHRCLGEPDGCGDSAVSHSHICTYLAHTFLPY